MTVHVLSTRNFYKGVTCPVGNRRQLKKEKKPPGSLRDCMVYRSNLSRYLFNGIVGTMVSPLDHRIQGYCRTLGYRNRVTVQSVFLSSQLPRSESSFPRSVPVVTGNYPVSQRSPDPIFPVLSRDFRLSRPFMILRPISENSFTNISKHEFLRKKTLEWFQDTLSCSAIGIKILTLLVVYT